MKWLNLTLALQAMIVLSCHASEPPPLIYNITDIRLINKTRPWAGVLEVYLDGLNSWGIICNGPDIPGTFDLATVACNRSGFLGTSRVLFATDFDDNGDNWSAGVVGGRATLSCSKKTVPGGNFLQCRLMEQGETCSLWNVLAVTCKGPGYLGCFSDPCFPCFETADISGRTISGAFKNIDSVAGCIGWCRDPEHADGPFKYAGVENGNQCFCGNNNYTRNGRVGDSECRTPCAGDTRDTCGGEQTISVYEVFPNEPYDPTKESTPSSGTSSIGIMTTTHDVTTRSPSTMTSSERVSTEITPLNGPGYLGCFNDPCSACLESLSIHGRTLSAAVQESGSNSVAGCISWCREHDAGPFFYAGVESGNQCFCGNDEYTRNGKVNDSECRAPCAGDTMDACGGEQKISVYEVTQNDKLDNSTVTTITDVTSSSATSMISLETMTTKATTLKKTSTSPSFGVGIGVAAVIILCFIVVVVITAIILRKRRSESNDGKNVTVAGGGDASFSRLSQRNQGNETTETNQYVESTEADANVNTPPSNDTNTYYSIYLPNDQAAGQDDHGIAMSLIPTDSSAECRAPTGGDVYTNTEFHDVPTNLVENELYNL